MYNFKNKNIHPRIQRVIIEMITNKKLGMEFYGQLALYVNFRKDPTGKRVPTAGVRVTMRGMEFVYNEKFISSLSHKQLRFLMIHEMLHLVCEHGKRRDKWNADKNISNIVMDMIINTEIIRNYNDYTEYPNNDSNHKILIPPEYEENEIWEHLYMWVNEKKKKDHKKEFDKYKKMICSSICNGQGQGQPDDGQEQDDSQGQGQGQGNSQEQDDSQEQNGGQGDGNSIREEIEKDFSGNSKEYKDMIETLAGQGVEIDVHLDDTVPDEIASRMKERAVDALKNRGLVGNTEGQILGKLRKKKKDYTKTLRKAAQMLKSQQKRRTFVRPNRKGINGLKGRFKKDIETINCVIDTSGSMMGTFEEMLSYVFKNDLHINLIQIDTEVKSVEQISNIRQFKDLEIKGLGGTIIQPAIDFIKSDRKFSKFNTLILTDGWTDNLDLEGLKQVIILTNNSECPILSHPRSLKQVIVQPDMD